MILSAARITGLLIRLLLFLGLSHALWASTHHPQDFLRSIRGKKNEGALIVGHYCSNCHAANPLIPLGAPRMGVISDWQPRLKDGLAALLQRTDEGVNAMPARGGCFECTDKQLLLAVLFMLPDPLKNSL